jgi:hypothetical protein
MLTTIKAKELKSGMRLNCDMGYGAHAMPELCEVHTVSSGVDFFKKETVLVTFRRYDGTMYNHYPLQPDDKLEVEKC